MLAETLAGSRPAQQVRPWTTEQARKRIRELGPMLRAAHRPRVRRVLTSQPRQGVVEMTVIVGIGPRTRAMAVRLECTGPDGSGPDGSGPDGSGPDGSGPDGTGRDSTGPDGTGADSCGPDGTGADSIDRTDAGPDNAGPARAGYGRAGSGRAGRAGKEPQGHRWLCTAIEAA